MALWLLALGGDVFSNCRSGCYSRGMESSYEIDKNKRRSLPGRTSCNATWSDPRNPCDPPNPDEPSVSVAGPSGCC